MSGYNPINLDELRAARGPVTTREVILGGKTFEVPARITVELATAAIDGRVDELIKGLFGDRAEEIMAVRPPLEVDDLMAIVREVTGGPGNSRSSTGS